MRRSDWSAPEGRVRKHGGFARNSGILIAGMVIRARYGPGFQLPRYTIPSQPPQRNPRRPPKTAADYSATEHAIDCLSPAPSSVPQSASQKREQITEPREILPPAVIAERVRSPSSTISRPRPTRRWYRHPMPAALTPGSRGKPL